MIIINKPKFDLREFVGGILDNGIKFAFIHDKLEKSYVSVAVNVGSYSNTKNYDGISHFLEHMLFMGSKKYPNENYYFEELNKLGGYSNAYTDTLETVYYFDVFDNGLEKMFDIFSRFFIDPLFNITSVKKEMNAVNSEHKKNINNDHWRKYQFILDILNKDSNMNNFGTGSLETLDKEDIREKLIEFYNQYYTTDNISICIASSKSFDELKTIINSTFGKIKKSSCQNKLEFNKPFYSDNKLNTYHLKTLSNIYDVSYIFEIPKQQKYLKTKYFSIFNEIIINKSEQSLYFNLTNMGYLHNIFIDIRYEGILIINLILSKEGLNNLDYVESSLYQAIDQINNINIKEYAKYYKKILKINYNSLHKFDTSNLCNMLAVNHYYYKTKDIFKNNFLITKIKTTEEYKHKFIKYINKNNVIRIICSQNYPFSKKIDYKKTKYYKTEYALVKLKLESKINKNNFVDFDFNNKYLKVKPKIIPNLDIYDIPQLIKTNQWYGGCSKFGEPLVTILLQINNKKYFDSAINYVLTHISCCILNYLIEIIMFKPLELSYSISFTPTPTTSSININISALNDVSKIKLLLEDLNKFLLNIDTNKISDNYINNLIISLKESYENINFLNPADYSIHKLNEYIYDTIYPIQQIISIMEIININQIKEYLENLLEESITTCFIYGNIDKKDISKLLDYPSSSKIIIPLVREIQETSIKHPNPNEKSNCVTVYYSIGILDIKQTQDAIKNIIIIIGIRILSQLFFDELRTNKQLGYLVKLGVTVTHNHYYINQKIQSDKDINILLGHIHEFNKNVNKYLTESDFDKFVDSIKKELMEPEYSLSDKINKYLPEITSHKYIFNRNLILLEQLNKVNKKDVIHYFEKLLLKPINFIIVGN